MDFIGKGRLQILKLQFVFITDLLDDKLLLGVFMIRVLSPEESFELYKLAVQGAWEFPVNCGCCAVNVRIYRPSNWPNFKVQRSIWNYG